LTIVSSAASSISPRLPDFAWNEPALENMGGSIEDFHMGTLPCPNTVLNAMTMSRNSVNVSKTPGKMSQGQSTWVQIVVLVELPLAKA
jgi:hypothetical protein